MKSRSWYNINSREPNEPSGGGGGRVIPFHVRRANAMKSVEGGVARCFKCGATFTVTYMQVCVTGTFTEPDWACADCRKQFQLRKAR